MNKKQKITIDIVAKTIGSLLVISAYSDTNALLQTLLKNMQEGVQLKITDRKFGLIHFELLHFYIHLTDRLAFLYLGKKRSEFFDLFFTEVFENHIAGIKKKLNNQIGITPIYNIFVKTHNERQKEYSKYKFPYDIEENENKGLGEDLFLQFAGRIAEILNMKNDSSIIFDIVFSLMPLVQTHHKLCKKFMLDELNNEYNPEQ